MNHVLSHALKPWVGNAVSIFTLIFYHIRKHPDLFMNFKLPVNVILYSNEELCTPPVVPILVQRSQFTNKCSPTL